MDALTAIAGLLCAGLFVYLCWALARAEDL